MRAGSYDSVLALAVGAVLVCAVAALWLSSVRGVVRVLAAQGLALGLVALLLGLHVHDTALVATAGVVVGLKAVVIPTLLRRVAGETHSRETRPLVNVPASLVAAAALSLLAFSTTRDVVRLVPTGAGKLVPVGFATLLLGFFVLVARRKPVFQMVGLLLVDNAVALIAFLITAGVPFLIELGVSLDVLLGVVVLMVLASRLRADYGEVDLDALQELRD